MTKLKSMIAVATASASLIFSPTLIASDGIQQFQPALNEAGAKACNYGNYKVVAFSKEWTEKRGGQMYTKRNISIECTSLMGGIKRLQCAHAVIYGKDRTVCG